MVGGKKMGAPRKWIKQLLGLKKSDKIVSLEDAEKSSRKAAKIWPQSKDIAETDKGVFNNERELEDEDWEWDLDPSSLPSTSHEAKNAVEHTEDRREESPGVNAKDGNLQSDLDPHASPGVQNADELQQDGIDDTGTYTDESEPESTVDSPTSPEVQREDQLQQYTEEATADVRESSESDPDSTSPTSSSHQVEYAAPLQQSEKEELAAIDAKDENSLSDPDPSSSPSALLEVQCAVQVGRDMQEELAPGYTQTAVRGSLRQNGDKTGLPMTEESAAICIQTVYRGFLAKRAFRALKGLARLQVLMKGQTLKRQTAIALRCIQALVKVQACSRAKHVLTALESQAVEHKLLQQLEHEAPVKKPEFKFTYNGWCDKVGSAREIQAKLLKRKEAAAKRDKAKAYALARQWRAGIRQQPKQQQQEQQQQQQRATPGGFPSDKTDWGWSWLERWRAIRPWETHLLGDASLREGAAVNVQTSALFPTEKKLKTSTGNVKLSPRLRNTKKVSNDGCTPSPRKSANAQQTPTTPVSGKSQRTSVKDSVRQSTSRLAVGTRSFSTPKERSTLSDNQEKKRLSLPGRVHGARLAQTAVKSLEKSGNPRSKLKAKDVKTSKLSR